MVTPTVMTGRQSERNQATTGVSAVDSAQQTAGRSTGPAGSWCVVLSREHPETYMWSRYDLGMILSLFVC